MALTSTQFWEAIDLIDRSAIRSAPNDSNAMVALAEHLKSLSISEIEGFEEQLSRLLYDIDGEQYCDAAGINSGDFFLYSRCFVVAMGEKFYTNVLRDPALMSNSQYEPLLYIASNAWSAKTGNTPDEWDYHPSVSYETGANSDRWSSPVIQLTQEQQAQQIEIGYQRAMSSAVHAHRRKSFDYVIELLSPYEDCLSKKFLDILSDARSRIESG